MTYETSESTRPKDDIDLKKVFSVLQRSWPALVFAPLLAGAGTYFWLSQVPPTYEARTSLMAGLPEGGNQPLSSAVVTASQLPQGAVNEVIHSRASVDRMIATINASSLGNDVKAEIAKDLLAELSSGQYRRITVRSKVDQFQRGVYELIARAQTPAAARVLANSAAQALIQWDNDRARRGVARARSNIQEQLNSITTRLNSLPPDSVERESLISARGQLLLNLSQATVFEQGATGSLLLLAEANDPRRPISPRPLRDAAIVSLLTLFTAAGLSLLVHALRRRVNIASDLPPGIPVLGKLPRLGRTARQQIVGLTRVGSLYEPAGFIQVNLLSALKGKKNAIIAMTSARPTEGKSTVVAITASALAMSGRRVLVIDFDLHRPTQHEYWPTNESWEPLPGSVLPRHRQSSVIQAIENPQTASALKVADNIYLIPATEVGRYSSPILNSPVLGERLHEWAQHFDVVLLDTPPVLSVADAFLVAREAEGLVLVVDSSNTTADELAQALRNFETSHSTLLGVVVNRVARTREDYTYYSYTDQKKARA